MRYVGFIVEDESDAKVLHELARKIATKKFAMRRVLANGCGRLHAKACAWAKDLHERGCTLLIVVCDLDNKSLPQLVASLTAALQPCAIADHLIAVPVREIEAWLISDHEAITKAFKLKKSVKKQGNPETIFNPKERLRDIIHERSDGRVRYLNTLHNERIAKHSSPSNMRRCPSFKPFEQFLTSHLS